MKALLYTILIFSQIACKNQYFTKVNKTLKADYPRKNSKIIESSFSVRKKIFELGYLSFITEKDTIFFLDDYHLESSTHYGSIWTKNKSFHYSYNKYVNKNMINEIIMDKKNNERGNKTFNLISKWDTTKIRQESNLNYNQLNPSHVVSAYRVYKNQEHIITNRITFRPFY